MDVSWIALCLFYLADLQNASGQCRRKLIQGTNGTRQLRVLSSWSLRNESCPRDFESPKENFRLEINFSRIKMVSWHEFPSSKCDWMLKVNNESIECDSFRPFCYSYATSAICESASTDHCTNRPLPSTPSIRVQLQTKTTKITLRMKYYYVPCHADSASVFNSSQTTFLVSHTHSATEPDHNEMYSSSQILDNKHVTLSTASVSVNKNKLTSGTSTTEAMTKSSIFYPEEQPVIMIVAIATASLVPIILVFVTIFVCKRKRRTTKTQEPNPVEDPPPEPSNTAISPVEPIYSQIENEATPFRTEAVAEIEQKFETLKDEVSRHGTICPNQRQASLPSLFPIDVAEHDQLKRASYMSMKSVGSLDLVGRATLVQQSSYSVDHISYTTGSESKYVNFQETRNLREKNSSPNKSVVPLQERHQIASRDTHLMQSSSNWPYVNQVAVLNHHRRFPERAQILRMNETNVAYFNM